MFRPAHLAAAALGVAALGTAAFAGAGIEELTTTQVASGLTRPLQVAYAPGDFTRVYIVEKQGRIRTLNTKTGALQSVASAFLNIDSIVGGGTSLSNEQGLLGLAFDPNFQSNGHFFVYHTNNSSDTQVARYTATTPESASTGSRVTVMTIDQPQSNHNGGWIAFNPLNDYLYVGVGDGGAANDSGTGHTSGTGNAQDITNNLLGKMLRIDVSSLPYTIPADNPFVGETGDDEIWDYGLRNPWRCAFDPTNGDLYIADVGQNAWEEVNVERGVSNGGANYGWRCEEGLHDFFMSCGTAEGGPFVDPVHEYSHSVGFSITGGEVYRGCRIPSLDGTYFFADWSTARIWSFKWQNAVTNFTERTSELDTPSTLVNTIAGFGLDALGEMYICDHGSGTVFRIEPEVPTVDDFYADLDCSGAVDVDDLVGVILNWGACDGCQADTNGDHVVNVDDLSKVILNWTF